MIRNVNGEYAAFSPNDEQALYDWGVIDERERIIKRVTDYFELTRFSQEVESAPANPDWDAGYQAAMSIMNGKNK